MKRLVILLVFISANSALADDIMTSVEIDNRINTAIDLDRIVHAPPLVAVPVVPDKPTDSKEIDLPDKK